MVSLEAPTSCQHSAFRWEVHGGSDFETIFPVSFRKKILGNSHHTFPHFFQMNLSHSKSVVSFSKTEGILSEALLSACLLSRLGDVFGAERRCKIMNLHLFCQGCTRKIANKFNLCFTSSPLPPFAISMLIYNRENRCLLQYRLFLRWTGTFHFGWHSIQLFIYFCWWTHGYSRHAHVETSLTKSSVYPPFIPYVVSEKKSGQIRIISVTPAWNDHLHDFLPFSLSSLPPLHCWIYKMPVV